ncbi:MAG: hypothetical protein R3A12_10205 [Ignavibacteria bacterium]
MVSKNNYNWAYPNWGLGRSTDYSPFEKGGQRGLRIQVIEQTSFVAAESFALRNFFKYFGGKLSEKAKEKKSLIEFEI